MSRPCDCCQGPRVLTPLPTANRPGLSQLRYRVGTHATFLETMRARLSNADYPELAALRTREGDDPSMALLDAWAAVGDVLTFYQERLANEGYLRTATERRSVLELVRLIGSALRPGVSASVYLAYSLDQDATPVEIPGGARVNSVPGPGEQMQAFETSEPLTAREEWSAIKPRLTQPQTAASIMAHGLYLKGATTNLKPNDPLLVDLADGKGLGLWRIDRVETDSANDRTRVVLRGLTVALAAEGTANASVEAAAPAGGVLKGVIDTLKLPPSVPPASSKQLGRSVDDTFAAGADTTPRLLASIQPALQQNFYLAWKNLPPRPPVIAVYALRVSAAPFGHNAPLRQTGLDRNRRPTFDEWRIDDPWNTSPNDQPPGRIAAREGGSAAAAAPIPDHHEPRTLYLDNDYDVAPDSFIVIEKPATNVITVQPKTFSLTHRSLAAYGVSGKTLRIDLPAGREWLREADESFATVRTTRVLAGSERLTLADEPMTDPVAGPTIELGDLYAELQPGRWLIVAGERSDIKAGEEPLAGVTAAELVMLAGVQQKPRERDHVPLVGERVHSFIALATPLAYTYRRDTVTIHGNVVHATHGETREETLGGGDAAQAFLAFVLKQPPLSYVSAPTVSGAASTLTVRVNEVQWREAETLAALGPHDRRFITRTADDGKTTVVFGNGERGTRPPTGQENIKATYRNGIGKPGNVRAGQISLLNTRPLGVKEVVNPIRASGGADRDSRDQARARAPLGAMALDRLVSVSDYADFARLFAGVGKAAAVRVSDGRRELVHVTIAGADDIPIETTSDLFRNLAVALRRYGDPALPVGLGVRERLALVVSAGVRIAPDYRWDLVEPQIRAAVLDAFSFDHVELGQDLLVSDAIRAIQRVPGVVYVDVDVFDSLSEDTLLAGLSASAARQLALRDRLTVSPARVERHVTAPAQLAYLSADVPDTLILQERKS